MQITNGALERKDVLRIKKQTYYGQELVPRPRRLALKDMRKFAECWPDREIVQRTAAQIPWRNNQFLMYKLKERDLRIWYAEQNRLNGWSRDILSFQIESNLHKRIGQSANNFKVALPPADSDMVNQIFKDTYIFDFLGTAGTRREREIESKLMDRELSQSCRVDSDSQMCNLWEDPTVKILVGSDELNVLEDEFGIEIDEETALDLYDMNLQEAADCIDNMIRERGSNSYSSDKIIMSLTGEKSKRILLEIWKDSFKARSYITAAIEKIDFEDNKSMLNDKNYRMK